MDEPMQDEAENALRMRLRDITQAFAEKIADAGGALTQVVIHTLKPTPLVVTVFPEEDPPTGAISKQHMRAVVGLVAAAHGFAVMMRYCSDVCLPSEAFNGIVQDAMRHHGFTSFDLGRSAMPPDPSES